MLPLLYSVSMGAEERRWGDEETERTSSSSPIKAQQYNEFALMCVAVCLIRGLRVVEQRPPGGADVFLICTRIDKPKYIFHLDLPVTSCCFNNYGSPL